MNAASLIRHRLVPLLLVITFSILVTPLQAQQQDQPNIVLIMADDLGAEALESYGGQSYDTPHLNRLAEDGMQFRNAYSTPLCTPTRVQLMTGQYPFRNGWDMGIWTRPRKQQYMDPDLFNFGQMLQNAGYTTAVAGKWQLARFEDRPHHARNVGFDAHSLWTWLYNPPGNANIRMEGKNKPSRYWGPGIWQNGKLLNDTRGTFGPDHFTNFLIDFIKRNRNGPFFAYFSMSLPHWPFVPVPGMDGDRDGTREGPDAQKNFAAMVEYTDQLVGRIVKTLNQQQLRDETIIIFTGDNGTAREINSDYRGRTIRGDKGSVTEAGTRVPLIVSWNGTTPEETVSEDLIDFSDFLPTLAEAAGAHIPDDHRVDGRSFLPQLKGKQGDPREWVFSQVEDRWFFRTHRYMLRKDDGYTFLDMSDRYDATVIKNPEGEAAKVKKRLINRSQKVEQKRSE